jgi:FixJ family two-component response regulator
LSPVALAGDETEPPSCASVVLEGRRILIVDDDPHTGLILGMFLRQLGYVPVAVRSAEEALAAVQEKAAAGAFVDVNLDGDCGIVLAKQLREQWKIPVVLICCPTSGKHGGPGFLAVEKPLDTVSVREALELMGWTDGRFPRN